MPDLQGKWFYDAERIRWDRRSPKGQKAVEGCPSLHSLCVKALAKNSRSLSEPLISYLEPKLLKSIWRELLDQQRDSLQLWFIFIQQAPSAIMEITPIYRISMPTSELDRVPIVLPRDVLNTYIFDKSSVKGWSIVLIGSSAIDLSLIKSIAAMHALIHIDLRNGVWPANINEVDRTIKHLLGSMYHGELRSVECLRLPEKGPMHLRNALRLEWPPNLRLLQCPVKPKDCATRWRHCSIREFSITAGTVSIELQGRGSQTKSSYVKGLRCRI